MTERRTNSSKW